MKYDSELNIAIEAVKKACSLCITVQSSLVSEETMIKKDKSPVTVADFGVQAIICHELKKAFPNDPIVAEEDSADLKTEEGKALSQKVFEYASKVLPELKEEEIHAIIDSGDYDGGPEGRFWTLDPIDGTKGFLRGQQYAVALALVENGEVVLGVLGCPNLARDLEEPESQKGAIFSAVIGEGSYIQFFEDISDKKINVSDIDHPTLAPFCESVESAHSSHGDSKQIAQILGVTAEPIRIDSQCKYAVLARGDASIYLRLPTSKDYVEKIWDHAAGYIIVKEAGGRVTDILGSDLDFSLGRTLSNNKGVVGTNGELHDLVISAVIEVLNSK
ncbi:MAG: 3'(2'),5'-bisphosphate nucleotidase [Candidatus Dadabacteria bacterium]|nr:3'(2'),5'-bisphosphate nucleotidase [Candidatus Dadabacteria bacterium]